MAGRVVYGDAESSRTWWVAWVCREADVPFANEAYGFLDPVLKSPGYLAINPNGLIPALREGEFVLWESLAVNLYLARKHAPDLYPDSAEEEARAWQWSLWAALKELPFLVVAASELQLRPGSTMERYFLEHVPKWAPDEVARSTGLVQRALAVLDGHLRGRAYLLGDRFSIADLNVACVLSFDQHARIALPGGVHRWLHACWSRPACPRRDALVESLKTLGPPSEAVPQLEQPVEEKET